MSWVIGGLLLVVLTTGTAVAATGQVVNIADGTNASYLAKVDSTGALKTAATSMPAAPTRPFLLQTTVYDSDVVAYNSLFSGTTAAIAVNRIVVTPYRASTAARNVQLYWFAVSSGNPCDDANVVNYRYIGSYRVDTNTVVDPLPSALLFKPLASGQSWCLAAYQSRDAADAANFTTVTISGWVVYGTPPASTVTSSSAVAASAPSGTAPNSRLDKAVARNR